MRPILSLLLLLCTPSLFAGTLKGIVRNAQGAPLASATVLVLRSADSGLVKAGVSGDDGRYAIDVSADGNFIIKALAPGYAPAYSPPFVCATGNDAAPDVALSPLQQNLHEVTVRSEKPLIEVHADKLVMNVESSITNTGSTAFEVLQRAPGVTVDQNDNISLKGKAGVNVMIDGKLLPVSGEDLVNILKGMPSASIGQIEIIANPGARYDAAGTAGIINIRTKKDKRMGANGTLTAGFGQGIYPKANGGIGLNYRNKKVALYGNYNYAYRKGINDLDLMRHFIDSGRNAGAYDQHDQMLINSQGQTLTLGCDYTLSSKTTVGAVLTGGLNSFDLSGDNATMVLDAAEMPASYFHTGRDNTNHWNNWGINLNLRHDIDTSGSNISVDADYARYANTSRQNLFTAYSLIGGAQQRPDYRLFGALEGYTDIRSFKADYTKPVNKTLRLEAGVKSSLVKADNDPAFYDRSGGGNVYDSGKSNHFIYDENINAAYLNAAKDWTAWSLQAGLRAEQTIAKGHQLINDDRFDRSYTQLFPSLALTRHLDPKNDLGITLSRRIERPSYQQLNPFRRYIDISSVNQGNPYLQPSLTWSAELTYTWKGKFITQFNWSRTTDVIIQVIQPEAGQVTVVTDKNLATNIAYTFSGTYPLQPAKWWSSVNNLVFWYNKYEGNLAATPLSAGKPAFYIYSQNSFTLPHEWSAEVSAFYQTEQVYGYMYIDQQYVIGIGLQKTLWDKKATLKLSVTDLLRQQSPYGRSEFSAYREDFYIYRDSRVATLTATYRFGKRSVAPTRRRQRGAEEELQRAGGGAG